MNFSPPGENSKKNYLSTGKEKYLPISFVIRQIQSHEKKATVSCDEYSGFYGAGRRYIFQLFLQG
jgi:hypothetical protein